MEGITLILVLAITVEALVQYGKNIVAMALNKEYKTFATQLAAVLLAVLVCFSTGADIYELLGVSFTVTWLGTLLTGIVISRGANYAADFIKRLQAPSATNIVNNSTITV